MSNSEVLRNIKLDAEFKLKFDIRTNIDSITGDTVFLTDSIGNKILCTLTKTETVSDRPVTKDRHQIEVVLKPIFELEKKTLYRVVASPRITGFTGCADVVSYDGATLVTTGYRNLKDLPVLNDTIFIRSNDGSIKTYIVTNISDTWLTSASEVTLTLNTPIEGYVSSTAVIRFGKEFNYARAFYEYAVETCGIVGTINPADGTNNAEPDVEILIGITEPMDGNAISKSCVQLHHVKWIPEYVEDLEDLINPTDSNSYYRTLHDKMYWERYVGGELKQYTKRWHEGHWASGSNEAFHMVKYTEEDTYQPQTYSFNIDAYVEYSNAGWIKYVNNWRRVYHARWHKTHAFSDRSHLVQYVSATWTGKIWTNADEPDESLWDDETEVCEQCDVVEKDNYSLIKFSMSYGDVGDCSTCHQVGGGMENKTTRISAYTETGSWTRGCGGVTTTYTTRWHQEHDADAFGEFYHVVSYVNPADKEAIEFNPWTCTCCEWVNSRDVDRANGKFHQFLITWANSSWMPNLKSRFNYYEFRESYSKSDWTWLSATGFETKTYPWNLNTGLSYKDNMGEDALPISQDAQYLIKIQPMSDMSINWDKVDFQTDFGPYLTDIAWPTIFEPRNLLIDATYELFICEGLRSLEGTVEGANHFVRFTVNPIIKSIYPEPNSINVLPSDMVAIVFDAPLNRDTITLDTIKLTYKANGEEVSDYHVNYNTNVITCAAVRLDITDSTSGLAIYGSLANVYDVQKISNEYKIYYGDTGLEVENYTVTYTDATSGYATIAGGTLQTLDPAKNISITGTTAHIYQVEFIKGNLRLTYANGDLIGDYYAKYVSTLDINRLPVYTLYIFPCVDRHVYWRDVVARDMYIGERYRVEISPDLQVIDGRTLPSRKVWSFSVKKLVKWISPPNDDENAALAVNLYVQFNYELDEIDNLFDGAGTIDSLTGAVFSRTENSNRFFIISEEDIFLLEPNSKRYARDILVDNLENEAIEHLFKSGTIYFNDDTISADPPTYETLAWIWFDVNYKPLTTYYVVIRESVRTKDGAHTRYPLIYRFTTNVFVEWTSPWGWAENVPLNSRFEIKFATPMIESTLNSGSFFIMKKYPQSNDANKDKHYTGTINYSSLSYLAGLYPVLPFSIFSGEGWYWWTYTSATKWLEMHLTQDVMNIFGETLRRDFTVPFSFHPFIQEMAPKWGERDVNCIIDRFYLYTDTQNLIAWDLLDPDVDWSPTLGWGQRVWSNSSGTFYPTPLNNFELMYLKRADGQGMYTDYWGGHFGATRLAPDWLRQEAGGVLQGNYTWRYKSPSGVWYKLMIVGGWNSPVVLEPCTEYEIVVSKDMRLNIDDGTSGGIDLDNDYRHIASAFVGDDDPNLANVAKGGVSVDWPSKFTTSIIKASYPARNQLGIPLTDALWLDFPEGLDQRTIINSKQFIYEVPQIKKKVIGIKSAGTTSFTVWTTYGDAEEDAYEIYNNNLTVAPFIVNSAPIMPIGTQFTITGSSKTYYITAFTNGTTFSFEPPLDVPVSSPYLTFTPLRVVKNILGSYLVDDELTFNYAKGVNRFVLDDSSNAAHEILYGTSHKNLEDLSVPIGTWFRIRTAADTFKNAYYITEIIESDATSTTFSFWPRLEADLEIYNTDTGEISDDSARLEFFPPPYYKLPYVSGVTKSGTYVVECTGFLNADYLPVRTQNISFINYDLSDAQIRDEYLVGSNFAWSYKVKEINCYRQYTGFRAKIDPQDVTENDTVQLILSEALQANLDSTNSVLLVPMSHSYSVLGSVYLKDNLDTSVPYVPVTLRYEEDRPNRYFRLWITPVETLKNSSLTRKSLMSNNFWCDPYLAYNYELIVTTDLKTYHGNSLLMTQSIPFKTWTYVTSISPANGSKNATIRSNVRATFKQNIFYKQSYNNGCCPDVAGCYHPSYDEPSGKLWEMDFSYCSIFVYSYPHYREGSECHNVWYEDESKKKYDEDWRNPGDYLVGVCEPPVASNVGNNFVTWKRAEGNPAISAASWWAGTCIEGGYGNIIWKVLTPDTQYKAVLAKQGLGVSYVDLTRHDIATEGAADSQNVLFCSVDEDENVVWYFKTNRIIYATYPENEQESIIGNATIRVVFIYTMDHDTIRWSELEEVGSGNSLDVNNSVYVWYDDSTTLYDAAGNISGRIDVKRKISCVMKVDAQNVYEDEDNYYEMIMPNQDENGNLIYGSPDEYPEPTYVPYYGYLAKWPMFKKRVKRTVVELTPTDELLPGKTYFITVTSEVKVDNSSGVYQNIPQGKTYGMETGEHFTSSFTTSNIVRSITIEKITDEWEYNWIGQGHNPRFLKIMFYRHMDADSLGAKETDTVVEAFYNVSVTPSYNINAHPLSWIKYMDREECRPVPSTEYTGSYSGGGKLSVTGNPHADKISGYARASVPDDASSYDTWDDRNVNIWLEWRALEDPFWLENEYGRQKQITIRLNGNVKSLPYKYDAVDGIWRVLTPIYEQGILINEADFKEATVFTNKTLFSYTMDILDEYTGIVISDEFLRITYPIPQMVAPSIDPKNREFVYGCSRQLKTIKAEFNNPLSVFLRNTKNGSNDIVDNWPFRLTNATTLDFMENVKLSFPYLSNKKIVQIDVGLDPVHPSDLVNGTGYDLEVWPYITFTQGASYKGVKCCKLGEDLAGEETVLYLNGFKCKEDFSEMISRIAEGDGVSSGRYILFDNVLSHSDPTILKLKERLDAGTYAWDTWLSGTTHRLAHVEATAPQGTRTIATHGYASEGDIPTPGDFIYIASLYDGNAGTVTNYEVIQVVYSNPNDYTQGVSLVLDIPETEDNGLPEAVTAGTYIYSDPVLKLEVFDGPAAALDKNTGVYRNGNTITFITNFIIQYVKTEWTKIYYQDLGVYVEQNVAWVVFDKDHCPTETQLNTWIASPGARWPRIYMWNANSNFNWRYPLELYTWKKFIVRDGYVRVLQLIPKVNINPTRRPWEAWAYGGLTSDYPFELVVNRGVSIGGKSVCGDLNGARHLIEIGHIARDYDPALRGFINIEAVFDNNYGHTHGDPTGPTTLMPILKSQLYSWTTVLIIDDESYVVNYISGPDNDGHYTLGIGPGTKSAISSSTKIYLSDRNQKFGDVDFVQNLAVQGYPELPHKPICSYDMHLITDGGCSYTNQAGIYEMNPWPKSEDVNKNITYVDVTFTDDVVTYSQDSIKVYCSAISDSSAIYGSTITKPSSKVLRVNLPVYQGEEHPKSRPLLPRTTYLVKYSNKTVTLSVQNVKVTETIQVGDVATLVPQGSWANKVDITFSSKDYVPINGVKFTIKYGYYSLYLTTLFTVGNWTVATPTITVYVKETIYQEIPVGADVNMQYISYEFGDYQLEGDEVFQFTTGD